MTCRKAKEFLSQKGAAVAERDFFRDRFSEAELRRLIGSRPVAEVFSWKSPSLKAMGLEGQELSDDEMIRLMLQEPRLIRRPLIDIDGELLVGFSSKALEGKL